MRIDDNLLDKLAIHFIYHDYHCKYGWTFEQYVDKYLRGVFNNGT